MNEVISKLKKNKIQILKMIITVADIYFLICSFANLMQEFYISYFMSLTMLYSIIIIICTLVSEFSPYILHNYLVSFFPFLTAYLGRGAVYIIIGSIYATPEIGRYLNYAGITFILVGILCILIHYVISSNIGNEHQDIIAMKNNYDDFSQNSLRESLTFPKRNIESLLNSKRTGK